MKKTLLLIIGLLLLLAVPACAVTEEEREDIIDMWGFAALQTFGDNMEAVISNLGEPEKKVSEEAGALHDSDSSTFVTLYYKDLEIGDWAGNIKYLKTTSPQYMIGGIRVGGSPQGLLKKLGSPDKQTKTEIMYETSTYHTITLKIKGDKITEIEIAGNYD